MSQVRTKICREAWSRCLISLQCLSHEHFLKFSRSHVDEVTPQERISERTGEQSVDSLGRMDVMVTLKEIRDFSQGALGRLSTGQLEQGDGVPDISQGAFPSIWTRSEVTSSASWRRSKKL